MMLCRTGRLQRLVDLRSYRVRDVGFLLLCLTSWRWSFVLNGPHWHVVVCHQLLLGGRSRGNGPRSAVSAYVILGKGNKLLPVMLCVLSVPRGPLRSRARIMCENGFHDLPLGRERKWSLDWCLFLVRSGNDRCLLELVQLEYRIRRRLSLFPIGALSLLEG